MAEYGELRGVVMPHKDPQKRLEYHRSYNKAWYLKNKEEKRRYYLKNKKHIKGLYDKHKVRRHFNNTRHNLLRYGLTMQEYSSILEKQNYVCAICGGKETRTLHGTLCRLSVDHHHGNGRVRGLLCVKCNAAVAFLGDDVKLVKRVLEYLVAQ